MNTYKKPSNGLSVWIFSLALVFSAGLMFWMQPMIAKHLLPKVGGAPAVWNAAMLFFQTALLGGYLYAHLLSEMFRPRTQAIIHISLLLFSLMWLPLGATDAQPPSGENPVLWVLWVLALSVGVPFVVIAASAPLLQTWFSFSNHKDSDNPYFLYGASNIGSMAALLGFPIIIEPALDVNNQAGAWGWGFYALIGLVALAGVLVRDGVGHHKLLPSDGVDKATGTSPRPITIFMWLALPLCTTSLMLGLTTHLTTDVAAVPMLWVIPLALFLATFIVSFARRPIVGRDGATLLMILSLLGLGLLWFVSGNNNWMLWALLLITAFFFTALACHTELSLIRPHKRHLTKFYLMIAVGGALGGAFNSLLAPILFNKVIEFPLMLLASVSLVVLARVLFGTMEKRLALIAVAGSAVLSLVIWSSETTSSTGTLLNERNFYGVLSINDFADKNARVLGYGTTIHGVQRLNDSVKPEPLSYYSKITPVKDIFAEIASRPNNGKVGAVGLGVGSIACYERGDRKLEFFEINPSVTRLASDPKYFTFLTNCPGDYSVTHGDGRLEIEKVADRHFDMLFIDAFTSDSIPTHLMTTEALTLYMQKLTPGGILVMHISNRHLDLYPVLGAIARELGLVAMKKGNKLQSLLYPASNYALIVRSESDLGGLADKGWVVVPDTGIKAWSDSYSNIFSVMDFSLDMNIEKK